MWLSTRGHACKRLAMQTPVMLFVSPQSPATLRCAAKQFGDQLATPKQRANKRTHAHTRDLFIVCTTKIVQASTDRTIYLIHHPYHAVCFSIAIAKAITITICPCYLRVTRQRSFIHVTRPCLVIIEAPSIAWHSISPSPPAQLCPDLAEVMPRPPRQLSKLLLSRAKASSETER